MAQTKNSTQNTFEQGLVMDFAPERAGDKTLSNALNATFITFNGNEWSLQNDMGNARVETAYLPTGYVPVGTCEFGDIIYIVSYNPIENKSQIGCFPSPERNISNKEKGGLGQSISSEEFVQDGKILASSVRKVVYNSSNISPGDKFIISWGELGKLSKDKISNYGNTSEILDNVETYWPKLLQVHVVSIEETGKITYLDSTVKWYTDSSTTSKSNNFIVSNKNLDQDTITSNLDTYRSAMSCQYSVFQSKVPGKLALYFELEKIDSFNCGHKIFRKITNDGQAVFDVYLSASWETNNYNINPCGMLITNSIYTGMVPLDSDTTLYTQELDDAAIYNCSRVIDFTRLYKMEDPGSSYEDFINSGSYYSRISDYQYIYDTQGNSALATNVLREYEFDSTVGIRKPKLGKGGVPSYVINPLTYEVINYNYYYKTQIAGNSVTCQSIFIPDDVIVNYFKKSVLKYVASVKIKTDDENDEKSAHTIQYTVCPCMPYGVLTDLGVTNTIYFNKAETGEVKLSRWQYYVNTNSITLRFGFDTYLKTSEDEVIDKILIEFYDNQGICATYELKDQETYDATFTEYFELDRTPSNARMTSKKTTKGSRLLDKEIPHKEDNNHLTYGNLIAGNYDLSKYFYYTDIEKAECSLCSNPNEKSMPNEQTAVYLSNAGILYYGRPYGARIKVYKGTTTELGSIDISGKEDPIIIDRWLWTAPIFNDNFTTTPDFKTCQQIIPLDFSAKLDGSAIKTTSEFVLSETVKEDPTSTFKVYRQGIKNNNGYIYFTGTPQLGDNYGNSMYLLGNALKYITVKIAVANPQIKFDVDTFSTVYENSNYTSDIERLHPVYDANWEHIRPVAWSNTTTGTDEQSYQDQIGKYCWTDGFNLSLSSPSESSASETFNYLDESGNLLSASQHYITLSGENWAKNKSVRLSLQGVKFTKAQAASTTKVVIKNYLKRTIETKSDLNSILGIDYKNGFFYHTTVGELGMSTGSGDNPTVERNQIECTSYSGDFHAKIVNSKSGSDGIFSAGNGDDVQCNFNHDGVDACMSVLGTHNIIPVVFGMATNDNGDCHEGVHGMWASRSLEGFSAYMYRQKPGDSQRIANGKDLLRPTVWEADGVSRVQHVKGTTNNVNVPVALGLKDASTGKYVIGADFRFYYATTMAFTQRFPWLSKTSKTSTGQSTSTVYNYAVLLASIFTQTYSSCGCLDANDRVRYYAKNIATCSDYTEYWTSDIVVNQSVNSEYVNNTANFNPVTSSSTLLGILPAFAITYNSQEYAGFNLFWYAAAVLKTMYPSVSRLNDFDDWNTKNENLKLEGDGEVLTFVNINPLFQTASKAVVFKYSIPNDLQYLRDSYEQSGAATILYDVSGDSRKIYMVDGFSDATKFYTFDSTNSNVSVVDDNSSFNMLSSVSFSASNNFIQLNKSTDTVPINTQIDFWKHVQSSGGTVVLKDVASIPGYDTDYDLTFDMDDDGHFYNLRGIYLFDFNRAW